MLLTNPPFEYIIGVYKGGNAMNLLAALPTWGIIVIVVVALIVAGIVALVISLIVREKRDKKGEMTAEEQRVAAESPAEQKSAPQLEEPSAQRKAPEDKKTPSVSAAAVQEERSAPEEEEPAYAEPEEKPAPPVRTQKVEKSVKKEPAKEAAPEKPAEPTAQPAEAAPAAEEKARPAYKTYHVSKRKAENKWQVKMAGGAKAIKMFITQAEAIDFAKKLAENQEAKIVIHKEDGTFRRLTYHKKK